MSITISIVGGPHSGKSTLASQINSILKTKGLNSVFCEEYAVEYIAKYGVPTCVEHQMIIFYEQMKKEKMFHGSRDFIVCDSSSWLSYIYSKSYLQQPISKQSLKSLNFLQHEILENINYWNYVFYVPVMENYMLDGVRYTTKNEAIELDKMIKGFLNLERVPYIDLSSIDLEHRIDKVIETILK
ncbi:hypothetical protein D3C87_79430 [compost metagenome]